MVALTSPANASHYMLVDVPDVVEAGQHATLAKAGIDNTAALYENVVTRLAREALSKRTGIAEKTLRSWARFLDLMQLSGIGPKMVRLLNAARVVTLRDLRVADAAELHARVRVANRGAKHSEVVPSADILSGWIGAAKRVTPRLE
jgi:predicted flap endonuclease-1-like 5' DNA nuclease